MAPFYNPTATGARGKVANAANRTRVGCRWVRRACLPCRRARGHRGRNWLGCTRCRGHRRHIGGCGRGRVVARNGLTGRSRRARDRHAPLAGRPKAGRPRGFGSRAFAAGPHADRAACAPSRRCHRRARSCAVRCGPGLCASARSRPRRCPKVACRPSWSRRACDRCSTVGPSSCCGSMRSRWTRVGA